MAARIGRAGWLVTVVALSTGVARAQDAVPPPTPTATPPSSSASVGDARQLMGTGDFAGAARVLEQVVAAQPDAARAWALLGFARYRTKDYAGALEAHLKAAEFPATAGPASYNVASAYALLGNAEQALAWLTRVREAGQVDISGLAADDDFASLRGDERFRGLLMKPGDFAKPFGDGVRVLREWVGEAAGDQFGWIARSVGDVDGDGFADVTTSAPDKDVGGAQAGRVYVFSGKTGAELWRRSGAPGDRLGLGIEAAGDVNADGVPDVIAGAAGAGYAEVFSGKNGATLLKLTGGSAGDLFGRKVSDLGDLDGDGHADVLVGAPQDDAGGEDAGRAYVFSGKNGHALLTLTGEAAGDKFGSAVAGWAAGGKLLIVVGAPDAGEQKRGRAYVYDSLAGTPAFVIEAEETGQQLGAMFVSIVGDVDADGTPDVYASDWQDGANGPVTGRIYVHSGRDGKRLLDLHGEQAGDGFGIGPADAGDLDGDGHADLVVGAWRQAGAAPMGGKVYYYSGADGRLLREIPCRVMGDTFGFDATGIGDADGDGVPDALVTSAWSAIRGPRTGRMFVIAGDSPGLAKRQPPGPGAAE